MAKHGWIHTTLRYSMLGLLLFSFVQALFLFGTASAERPSPQTPNYNTAQATRGSYVETHSEASSDYFSNRAELCYKGDGIARFVEYTVKRGDAVNKGDIVAVFAIDSGEADYARAKLAHTRAWEDFTSGKLDWEKKVSEAQKSPTATTDEYDRQMQQLKIERLQLEYRLYCLEQERNISILQAALDEQAAKHTRTELRAPFSGEIEQVEPKNAGDIVLKNEPLIIMSGRDSELISVKDGFGRFLYNAPVTIAAGPVNKRVFFSGRVIASDAILPQELRSERAVIRIENLDGGTLENVSVTVETKRADGVILVPNSAVKQEDGKAFVNKLSDGVIQKRYVVIGGRNLQDAWVVTGLEEGETVVIG